jgi:SMI1-KNR4 cell-wall
MWRKRLTTFDSTLRFSEGVSDADLDLLERSVGCFVTEQYRSLLLETNGVLDQYEIELVWTLERVIHENRAFEIGNYMSVSSCLFFADAGNGDYFFFPIDRANNCRNKVFVWNHENDSRLHLANDLEEFLEGWVVGSITV